MTRVLLVVGALSTLIGLLLWFVGRSSYNFCTGTNDLSGGLVRQNCSMASAHVGLILFLCGIGAILLAGRIRIAET